MEFDFSLEPGRVLDNRYNVIYEEPLVSIITPFYNAGKYFEQTFNSVMNQTFPYFEWIIVNDGSTNPDDVMVLEQLAKEDSRIRVLHKDNGGAASARNLGVKNSRTENIAFLDADDLFDERYLEYAYFALILNPEAMWVYSDSLGFDQQAYLWQKEFRSETMKFENILPYASVIRRSVFNNEKYYENDTKNLWEDYQLWLKLLADGHYPAHLKQIHFWYRRQNSGWLSKIDNDEKLKRDLEQKIRQLSKKVPDGIRAITFDGKKSEEFKKPYTWQWDRKLPFKKKKTRILLLLPHMEMGGADKFNLDIITNINKEKYEIGIITTVPAGSEWRQRFTEQVRDVFELPSFLDRNDWPAFIHYYINSRAVDIVLNISSYYGYYTLPWLRSEFPRVAIIDCVHAEGKYWRSGGYPRVSAALDFVLEKTFVTNNYTQTVLTERYGKNRDITQVIYTGVDQFYFNPDNIKSRDVRREFEIADDCPMILYLCRLVPEKRPFLMLEVAKAVKEKIKNVCFLVVGDGPQSAELKEKVKADGLGKTVIFAGKQDDIRPFYKECDIFLLTSIKEGLSITTMEAMLMAKPVVSADVGSQYELVTQETGRLITCRQDEQLDFDARSFPKEEIAEYTDAICALLSDNKALIVLGKACREKILSGFTLNRMITTLENNFDALMSAGALEKRETVSVALRPFVKLAEDYLALYAAYENKEAETEEIWQAKDWFRQLYENANHENADEVVPAPADNIGQSQAELMLQEIYNMRTWKLIQRYRRFMDKTVIGKVLSKFRNLFIGI